MIIVVEPQCQGFAHEQFNAAFLYGYCLAYPQSKIVFFAESEHIKCVKSVLESSGLFLKQIEFKEIIIPDGKFSQSPTVFITYVTLLKKILKYAYDNNCGKISFLSIYTYNLIPLKYLLKFKYKSLFNVHLVLHGTLEFVKRKNFSQLKYSFAKLLYYFKRISGIKVRTWKYVAENRFFYEKLFKFSLNIIPISEITYLVLRDDILANVRKYLPSSLLKFRSIDLPYIFTKPEFPPQHSLGEDITFATFGKGYNDETYSLIESLTKQPLLKNRFTLKIIGGPVDLRLNSFAAVKYPFAGRNFSRTEIAEIVKKVDYFVFFYGEDLYELTTSGAFFDAIAYNKPIIFLRNNCFDYYFKKFNYGYRYENMESLINNLPNIFASHLINYPQMLSEILRLQNSTSIKHTYLNLAFE